MPEHEIERIKDAMGALIAEILRKNLERGTHPTFNPYDLAYAFGMATGQRRKKQIEDLLHAPVIAACENAIGILWGRLAELGVSGEHKDKIIDQIMDEHLHHARALDRAWIDKQRHVLREDEAGSEQ